MPNSILDYVFDSFSVSSLSDSISLKDHYIRQISEFSVRSDSVIFKAFQLSASADVFIEIFNNFKPGIDCDSRYFKIVNCNYLKSVVNR